MLSSAAHLQQPAAPQRVEEEEGVLEGWVQGEPLGLLWVMKGEVGGAGWAEAALLLGPNWR